VTSIPGFTATRCVPDLTRRAVVVPALAGQITPPYMECVRKCRAAGLSGCEQNCRPPGPGPGPTLTTPPPTVYPANTWTTMEPRNCVATQESGGYVACSSCPCSACQPTGMPDVCTCLNTEVKCQETRCDNWVGPCTGGGLGSGAPTNCINVAGFVQCCGSWNQMPWVKRCADGSAAAGCGGPCW
jgi:hypothetical protein